MKFPKNSFIFLETVFSILILSSVIALFFNIKISKEHTGPQLQSIENAFLTHNFNEYFTTQSKSITFIKNESETLSLQVQQTTYDDGTIKLVRYE